MLKYSCECHIAERARRATNGVKNNFLARCRVAVDFSFLTHDIDCSCSISHFVYFYIFIWYICESNVTWPGLWRTDNQAAAKELSPPTSKRFEINHRYWFTSPAAEWANERVREREPKVVQECTSNCIDQSAKTEKNFFRKVQKEHSP